MNDNGTGEKYTKRYIDALHAVQSGVKIIMENDIDDETSLKHLRVGVNSALVDVSALAGLLIKKKIITQNEFLEALAERMEEEKISYEVVVSKFFGKRVVLK